MVDFEYLNNDDDREADEDDVTDELLELYNDVSPEQANAVVARNTTMLEQLRQFERAAMDHAIVLREALHLGRADQDDDHTITDYDVAFQLAIEYARFGDNGLTPVPENLRGRENGFDDPLSERVIFPTLVDFFEAVSQFFFTDSHEYGDEFQLEDYEDLRTIYWNEVIPANIVDIHRAYRTLGGAAANNAARQQVNDMRQLLEHYLYVYNQEFFTNLPAGVRRIRRHLKHQRTIARRIAGRPHLRFQ